MRHPQVVIFEGDGTLARRLASLWERQRWAVREPRRLEGCFDLLRQPLASVFVLRLNPKDLVNELTLLDWVTAETPAVASVVVADTTDPELIGLLWDLGARFVLVPPLSWDLLEPTIIGLMNAALAGSDDAA